MRKCYRFRTKDDRKIRCPPARACWMKWHALRTNTSSVLSHHQALGAKLFASLWKEDADLKIDVCYLVCFDAILKVFNHILIVILEAITAFVYSNSLVQTTTSLLKLSFFTSFMTQKSMIWLTSSCYGRIATFLSRIIATTNFHTVTTYPEWTKQTLALERAFAFLATVIGDRKTKHTQLIEICNLATRCY